MSPPWQEGFDMYGKQNKVLPADRRPRGRARVVAALVAGVALTTTTMITAPMANAATCDGAQCNGKDPQTTGCAADGKTKATVTEGDVLLELRYSASCHAKWARLVPGKFLWHFTVYNADGNHEGAWAWGTATQHTNMVNGYPAAQACFDNGKCTPWV